MSKYFNFKSIALFFSIIFFISSCRDDDTSTSDTSASTTTTTSTDASPVTTTPVANAAAFAGTLDILMVGRRAFTDLPNGTKLVFSHNFGADDKVHVKGWVLQGNTFPGTSMQLENGAPSNESYDGTTYFSNVVLMPNSFNDIKRALLDDPNWQYVLFIPYKVDTYFIGYHIYPSITKAFASPGAFAPTAEANPSPPRIY
jgi:hypothetical protein